MTFALGLVVGGVVVFIGCVIFMYWLLKDLWR